MSIKKTFKPNFRLALEAAGFRVTSGRLQLLQLLWRSQKPLKVQDIQEKLPLKIDRVTIYRALEALLRAGLIRRVDFQHDHAHYEINIGVKHHHHIICTKCGAVEDFHDCHLETLSQNVLRQSSRFQTIQEHSLELFGICKKCN